MRRRTVLKGIGTSIGLLGLTGLYSWQVEPFWLEVVHRPLNITNLPETLKGKVLMQISDMHVGKRFDPQYIIDSFQKVQAYQPDIVVYTGDFMTYENTEQFEQLKSVLKSAVKGRLATVAIFGNHDYGHGWNQPEVADQLVDLLGKHDIEVLRNESADINGLNILGIDDYWGTNFDPTKVLSTYDNSRANLVLCHNPDVCDLDIWNGYQGWILSGHTHGGQLKPPFLDPPMLPVKNKRYTCGAFDLYDGRQLYINRALGHLHQVRFNVRPEITVFTLF